MKEIILDTLNEMGKLMFLAIAMGYILFALYLWGPMIVSGTHSYLGG